MRNEFKLIYQTAAVLAAIILICTLLAGCSGGDAFTADAPQPTAQLGTTHTTGGTGATLPEATGGDVAIAATTSPQAAPTGGSSAIAATGGTSAAATGGSGPTATGGNLATGGTTQTTTVGPAGYGTAASCDPGSSCTGPASCSLTINGVPQSLICCNGKMSLPTTDQCTKCAPAKATDPVVQPYVEQCRAVGKQPWVTCTTAPSPGCYMLGNGLACC